MPGEVEREIPERPEKPFIRLHATPNSTIKYLVSYGRKLHRKQDYLTLGYLLRYEFGWRAFNDRVLLPPRWSEKNDRLINGDSGGKAGFLYKVNIRWPDSQRGKKAVAVFPFTDDYPEYDLGDFLFRTTWENKRVVHENDVEYRSTLNIWSDNDQESMSPQIESLIGETTSVTTTIKFRYIKPKFIEKLVNPVSTASLDHTILDEEVTVNTLSEGGGRGATVAAILEELKLKFASRFPDFTYEIHILAENYLVRMDFSSRVLTDFLDEIHKELSGRVDWEWVDHNKILLLPGDEFVNFEKR